MKLAFADTYYFLALLNVEDRAHAEAVAISQEGISIVTSAWVLVEVADALSAPDSRAAAMTLFDVLRNSQDDTVIPATAENFDRGVTLFRRRADKAWSLTDCISFELKRELKITDALTGDRHFEQASVRALLKPD